jgi:PPOX class probable F420-dependent enzyme
MKIPESYLDLLDPETRSFAFLATIMPDGSPQVTITWVDTDGTHILINTAEGRVKDNNLQNRPAVAVCIPDPDDSYRFVQIRGKVVNRTREGAEEHIDMLSRRYTGEAWQYTPGQVRVIYKILPEHVSTRGGD